MVGTFTPFPYGRRYLKLSRNVGWITDENGCDIWQGANCGGYGHVRVGGKRYSVHRLRYEREIGPIPSSLTLDHYVCNNGAGGCCNPHHCRPVTRAENSRRGAIRLLRMKPRAPKSHCINGHALTDDNLEPAAAKRGIRRCHTCRKSQARTASAAYWQRQRQREHGERANH